MGQAERRLKREREKAAVAAMEQGIDPREYFDGKHHHLAVRRGELQQILVAAVRSHEKRKHSWIGRLGLSELFMWERSWVLFTIGWIRAWFRGDPDVLQCQECGELMLYEEAGDHGCPGGVMLEEVLGRARKEYLAKRKVIE